MASLGWVGWSEVYASSDMVCPPSGGPAVRAECGYIEAGTAISTLDPLNVNVI
jgi:hypothetical protein